jgi:hypothetical protein
MKDAFEESIPCALERLPSRLFIEFENRDLSLSEKTVVSVPESGLVPRTSRLQSFPQTFRHVTRRTQRPCRRTLLRARMRPDSVPGALRPGHRRVFHLLWTTALFLVTALIDQMAT